MPRRITTILLLTALLPISMGLAESLHSRGPGHPSDSDQCEICYVLATAVIAVVVSTALACASLEVVENAPAAPARRPPGLNLLTSIAPRAPPIN